MHVAGPIANPDEARALEQAAYLFDLQNRLTAMRRRVPSLRPRLGPRP